MNRQKMLASIAGLAAGYGAFQSLKPRLNRWGATMREHSQHLPGYEFSPSQEIVSTQAVTINAPPSLIWPWLVQMGQNRAGFYSFSWLENLLGCQIQNADRIVPEWQSLKKGDKVYLHPKAPPLTVTFVEPERSLALEGWIFQLKPLNGNRTRLISRTYSFPNGEYKSGLSKIADQLMKSTLFDVAHFFMGRQQLKQIKSLAEAQWRLHQKGERNKKRRDRRQAAVRATAVAANQVSEMSPLGAESV